MKAGIASDLHNKLKIYLNEYELRSLTCVVICQLDFLN